MAYELLKVKAFSLLQSIQIRKVPSFFEENAIGAARTVIAGSMGSCSSIQSILTCLNSWTFGPARCVPNAQDSNHASGLFNASTH